jgi:hypothetical protein
VPVGSKLVRDARGILRLSVFFNPVMDAETAAWCAQYQRSGFRIRKVGEQVAKLLPGQQSLFDDQSQASVPTGSGPYVKPRGLVPILQNAPRPDDRLIEDIPFAARAQAVALEVVRQAREDARAEVGRQFGRMETAIGRAIVELSRPVPQPMLALAILRECRIPETAEQRAG